MLFNSLEFGFFLPIVFLLYWFVFERSLKWQNALILAASYFFYGWWDWRFLFLIIFSSTLDFYIGQKIYLAKEQIKKYFLWVSLTFNLGLLCLFKYFNFFLDSFVDAFSLFGLSVNSWSLNIILPVGISFYTFQTLSYTIDIYRGNLKPSKDIISFFAFVSFFPQLVAGPIERAANLLPQFETERKFNYPQAVLGMRQMLWGFFKKMVIADNCALVVNDIFYNAPNEAGFILLLGAILFTVQVYTDFSGYSDIAIGCAKLFGFKLMINFKTPYFSTSWGEFWKRWHISLSSWILDYVFNPIAINKRHWGVNGLVYGLMITFILNGLWHGANWTFVLFGFILGIYISLEFLLKKYRTILENKIGSKSFNFLGWGTVMTLWIVACVFFRAESIGHAIQYFSSTFSNDFIPQTFKYITNNKKLFLFIILLFILEWHSRKKDFNLNLDFIKFRSIRWAIYFSFVYIIFNFHGKQQDFIYFQF